MNANEDDSGSHSIIFIAILCVCEQLIKKPYPRLSVLRNKTENMKNRSKIR